MGVPPQCWRAWPGRRASSLALLPDGTILKNPTSRSWLGPWAWWRRPPLRTAHVVIVGAGPAGLATAVSAHRRASPSWCWKRLHLEDRRAPARASRLSGVSDWRLGQALMARAFTQAQKFGAEFSLSTEVTRLD
jgi:thioredoxin reductase (NADPH)